MTNLTVIDREALELITRFEGATDPLEDALSQYAARQLLHEVLDYDVANLTHPVLALILRLDKALPAVPVGTDWRSEVSLIASEARHLLAAPDCGPLCSVCGDPRDTSVIPFRLGVEA